MISPCARSGRAVDAGGTQAWFDADRRVEADCASAGEDIGPLRP